MTSPRIFDHNPSSWEELELMVAQAFDEMGYDSQRGYKLETVRGSVNIDVYAVNRSMPIPTVILCECKHWNKPVEQSIVHAFRAVCGDAGAHFGLIISKAGFQSGAKETATATNIHLMNFIDFQETYFSQWQVAAFSKFARMCDILFPLVTNDYSPKDPALRSKLEGVQPLLKYEIFFGSQGAFRNCFLFENRLPLKVHDPRGDPHTLSHISVKSYRQYYQLGIDGFVDACRYFELLPPMSS